MNTQKILGIIILIAILIGLGYLVMRQKPAPETNTTTHNQAEGRVVFSLTDAAATMSAVSDIEMSVSKIEMHSAANGWVTVSTTPRTFNLLALKASGESMLMADARAAAGTYNQVRLSVDKVIVKLKNDGNKEAKLPSGTVMINLNALVKENNTTSINLDVIADKSLHVTGNGQYIFAPVIKILSKSDAQVTINSNNSVRTSGGRNDDDENVGMDVDGNMKEDFEIDEDKDFDISSNGEIKIKGSFKN